MRAPYLVDIGNTRIKSAVANQLSVINYAHHQALSPLFNDLIHSGAKQLFCTAGRSTDAQQSYRRLLDFCAQRSVSVTTVTVSPQLLAVNYVDLATFGADRFLHLFAARARQPQDICVVSAGTAITLDFYSDRHLGGMILPGMGSAKHLLAEKTSLTTIDVPDTLLGHSTATCIGAGIYHGYRNLVASSIARVSKQHGIDFTVFYTGGDAQHVCPSGQTVIEPLLFEGMHLWINATTNGDS